MMVRDKGQEMIEQEGEKEGNGPHPCETVKSIPSLQDLRIERKVSYLNLFQRRNLIVFLGGAGCRFITLAGGTAASFHWMI